MKAVFQRSAIVDWRGAGVGFPAPLVLALLVPAAPAHAQDPLTPLPTCDGDPDSILTGAVLDRESRVPIAGAQVELTFRKEGDGQPRSTQTTGDGLFRFCDVESRVEVELLASYASVESRPRRLRAGSGRRTLILELDLGASAFLVVTVVDAQTGRPVPGATLQLAPFPLGGTTNEVGRLKLRLVPPGEYRLRARHIAFAPFEGSIFINQGQARELRVDMVPRVLAVAPIDVTITRRDPYLVAAGFYDRMATVEEGHFFTYWDVEPYARLSSFFLFKTIFFIGGTGQLFIDGRPFARTGYESIDEIPFGKVRGIERLPCSDMPPEVIRYMAIGGDCLATFIWMGNRRTRSELAPPPGR